MSLTLSHLSALRVNVAAALVACMFICGPDVRAADNAAPAPGAQPPVDSELSRRVLEALSRNAETANPPKPPAIPTPAPQPAAPAAARVPMPFPAVTPSTPASPALPAPAISPAAVHTPAVPGAAVPLTHLSLSNNNNPQPVVVRVPEATPAPVPAVTPAPARATVTRPAAAAATSVIAGSSYTIRPGDTFSSIAAEKYGDEKKWTAIAQANPLVDPAKLKVGQVIRLPDLKAFEAQRSQPFEQVRQGLPPAAPAVAGPGGEVTVQKGDTLSHIAAKVYGKPTLWPAIYRANRDVLDTPNDVKPGMKLKIPKRES